MRAAIDPATVIETILSAAVDASEDGLDAHLPLDVITDRNEQWVQSYVGVHLNDLARKRNNVSEGVYVNHEPRVSWMDDMTSVQQISETGSLSPAQRFDLAVWNDDGVEGLVEIKNAPGMDAIRFKSDIDRLKHAMKRWGATRGGSLRWSAYLFSVRLTRTALAKGEERLLEALYQKRFASIQAAAGISSFQADFRPANMLTSCCLGWGVFLLD